MIRIAALFAVLPLMSQTANYTAVKLHQDGIEIVRLTDARHKTEVSIAPTLGNNSYEMKVNGKNIFWSPYATLGEFQAKPAMLGNPLLAPFANRLDSDGFYANGRRFSLDSALPNIRRDGNGKPIHGLLLYAADWKVTTVTANQEEASVVSRLEFWRNPDLMAHFPFAHTIQMTYRLRDGILEVETQIENHSTEIMPVSIGFHPYFKLHDAPRDRWKVTMPVRESMVLSDLLIPTGQTRPMPYANPQSLAGTQLDDVFTGLIRGESGRAEFSVEGTKEKLFVLFGPKYPVAIVYAPAGKDFICFEPMTGPTNAFNLHHEGKYAELQTIPPGGRWRESFWIHPTGF